MAVGTAVGIIVGMRVGNIVGTFEGWADVGGALVVVACGCVLPRVVQTPLGLGYDAMTNERTPVANILPQGKHSCLVR